MYDKKEQEKKDQKQGCFMKPEPRALLDEKHTIFKFCIYTDDRTLEDSS